MMVVLRTTLQLKFSDSKEQISAARAECITWHVWYAHWQCTHAHIQHVLQWCSNAGRKEAMPDRNIKFEVGPLFPKSFDLWYRFSIFCHRNVKGSSNGPFVMQDLRTRCGPILPPQSHHHIAWELRFGKRKWEKKIGSAFVCLCLLQWNMCFKSLRLSFI